MIRRRFLALLGALPFVSAGLLALEERPQLDRWLPRRLRRHLIARRLGRDLADAIDRDVLDLIVKASRS